MKVRGMETYNTLRSYALCFTVPGLGRPREDRVATGSHTRGDIMLVCCTVFTDWREMGLCSLKTDSHISCLAHAAHAFPLPCRATKGLECVFPMWFTQCSLVWFTLAMPCPCCAHEMLWPCRSSQGHGTARPSTDGLWVTCPRSASSVYHAEFHEDGYQKHTDPAHNDSYLRL